MDETKKQVIKESNYTYRDALEVSAYIIEVGKFERFYNEMQIQDLQKELDEWMIKTSKQKSQAIALKRNYF